LECRLHTRSRARNCANKLAPLHPGEILHEDFLKPLGLSINGLARALHVPANHVSGIVNEKRGISALMVLRLARYFGTSPELWLGLQQDYELDVARDTAAAKIEIEVLPRAS
jgi:addiction module HigA family antidote